MTPVGYESEIVLAYLDEHGARRPDGRFATINEGRVTESNRDMIERWETLELVPLRRIDDVLMRYGLMLWELEHWAEQNYGRDGYHDPYSEPKELVG